MLKSKTIETIKKHWSVSPVNIEFILNDLGLECDWSADLDPEISGMIEPTDDGRYLISINKNDAPTRKRFTAAHELGHFLYHKDLIGIGVDDNRLYRSTNVGKFNNTNITQKHETQANAFAANILMPKHLIEPLMAEIRAGGENDRNSVISALANRLNVSVPAMRVRMGYSPYPEN